MVDDEGAEVREEYYECRGRVVVVEASGGSMGGPGGAMPPQKFSGVM